MSVLIKEVLSSYFLEHGPRLSRVYQYLGFWAFSRPPRAKSGKMRPEDNLAMEPGPASPPPIQRGMQKPFIA